MPPAGGCRTSYGRRVMVDGPCARGPAVCLLAAFSVWTAEALGSGLGPPRQGASNGRAAMQASLSNIDQPQKHSRCTVGESSAPGRPMTGRGAESAPTPRTSPSRGTWRWGSTSPSGASCRPRAPAQPGFFYLGPQVSAPFIAFCNSAGDIGSVRCFSGDADWDSVSSVSFSPEPCRKYTMCSRFTR
jgi:hypothetical protein